MAPIEDMKRHKSIIDAYCTDALDIMEIATVYNVPLSDVIDILRDFQRGPQKMIASEKFKRRVAEFVRGHPEVSLANVARTFFLKDKRSVNRWCEMFSVKTDRDNQHSLLETNNEWRTKYDQLVHEHNRLQAKLSAIAQITADIATRSIDIQTDKN